MLEPEPPLNNRDFSATHQPSNIADRNPTTFPPRHPEPHSAVTRPRPAFPQTKPAHTRIPRRSGTPYGRPPAANNQRDNAPSLESHRQLPTTLHPNRHSRISAIAGNSGPAGIQRGREAPTSQTHEDEPSRKHSPRHKDWVPDSSLTPETTTCTHRTTVLHFIHAIYNDSGPPNRRRQPPESRTISPCSIRVPPLHRSGTVCAPIVFRRGPDISPRPATKRNKMEQNGTQEIGRRPIRT